MLWALYGLLHSFLRAAFVETNRTYKTDGWVLAFGQALCGFILLLFFVPFMTWPHDPHFYRAAVGASLIFAIGMLMHLTLSGVKTGRVSGIYMPLEALAASVIWVLVTPDLLDTYENNVLMTSCVVIAFVFCTGGLIAIRPNNDLSWRNFLLVAPLGITYAVAGTVTKTVMTYEDLMPAALAYTLIGFATMTVVTGGAALAGRKVTRASLTGPAVKASALAGLVSVCSFASFVLSVSLAPNPGYTSVLAMLLPVWLLLWHGIVRIPDRAHALAALFIVIGAFLLIVAAW